MSEDYLWDKTGEDQEIERLENVLSVFRYPETHPPVLPTTSAVPVTGKMPRYRFSFAFAFASAMAVVVIGLALFWLIPRGREIAVDEAQSPMTVIQTPVSGETVTRDRTLPSASSVSKNDVFRPSFTRHSVPFALKQRTAVAKVTQKKLRMEDLTREEKYAYSQLMLALSITSSKLKDVRETIDRIENDKASGKQNFR